MDGEDGDAVVLHLAGQRLRHAVEAGLRGRIGAEVGVAARRAPRRARHVDDAASAALDHARQHRARDEELAEEVDLDRPAPHLGVDLPERAALLLRAGVVDQDVDRPELALGLGDEALDVCLHRHVGRDGQRLAPSRLDRRDRVFKLAQRPGRDRDGCSFRREPLCYRLADAASTTRDNRHLTLKTAAHFAPPVTRSEFTPRVLAATGACGRRR